MGRDVSQEIDRLQAASDYSESYFVHGFSVPYYLWDPVVTALTGAGFQTLRYDLFGRGFSDRPNVSYNADLYDHQLTDLLNGLHHCCE